jgi:rhamnosyltransferase
MVADPPAKETICATVVTYNPDGGFPDRIVRVKEQVGEVVVVDNSSEPGARDMVAGVCARLGLGEIENRKNLGVATALNQGVFWARERSFPWVLTLDQDSVVEPFLVESLTSAYRVCPFGESVGVIGANYRDEKRGKTFLPFGEEMPAPWVEQTTAISSGSLISLSAFDRIGPFREEFFVDHVDDEYCLRARSMGFRVILCRRPAIRHPIGAARATRILGWEIWSSNHNPMRRYYMARNFTILLREYLFSHPGWILHRAARHAGFFLLMLLLEGERKDKITHTAIGIRDAIRGRMGKLRAEDVRPS